MYFGDMGHTIYTLLFTRLVGLLLAAPVYALIWILARRRFPAKTGIHVFTGREEYPGTAMTYVRAISQEEIMTGLTESYLSRDSSAKMERI